MAFGAITSIIGAGLGIAGALMGSKKKLPPMPPPVLTTWTDLSNYPPSPVRDQMMNDFLAKAGQVGDIYEQEIAKAPAQFDEYGNTVRDVNSHLKGLATSLEATAMADPYMEAFSSPLALRQRRLGESQEIINANYDRYGSTGRQVDAQQRQMADNMSARGIASGGYAQRLQQELALATQQQKGAELAQAQKDADDYQMKAGSIYQQGKQIKGQQLGAAADITNQQARNQQGLFQDYVGFTNNLANQNQSYSVGAANMEKAARDEEQGVKTFNLQGQYNNQAANADRQNNFALQNWSAQAGLAASTPSLGQRLAQVGGIIGGMGSMLGGFGGNSSGGGGCATGGCSTPSSYGRTSSTNNYSLFSPMKQTVNYADYAGGGF